MFPYLLLLSSCLFSLYCIGIQFALRSQWTNSYRKSLTKPISYESAPFMYSDIRDALQPDFAKENSFASYEKRLQNQLRMYTDIEVSCFSNKTENCMSFNNDENMIASKPYKEEDLIIPYKEMYETRIHSTICTNTSVEVIVGIPISPSQFAERQAIRKTWCNHSSIRNEKVKCVFFCGQSEQGPWIDSFVREEALLYNDIVQFGFQNGYLNLTLLQIYSYNWTIQHCHPMNYYIRADSDMFMNLHVAVRKIIPFPKKQFAYGIGINRGIPIRHPLSKYYLPKWLYPDDFFRPYLSGCMYIWSRDVVETVINGTETVRPIHYIDDVYYGQIFDTYHIPLKSDYANLYWYQIPFSQRLWKHVVAAHRYSPIDLLSMWKLYSNEHV